MSNEYLPRLLHVALCVVGFTLSALLAAFVPYPAASMAGGVLMAMFFIFGLALFLLWYAHRQEDIRARRMSTDRMTPLAQVLQYAGRLSPEQAAIVPKLTYEMQLAVTVGMSSARDVSLVTGGGLIPYVWIEYYLRHCGPTYLYPVRRFQDDTPNRAYAEAFTHWLLERRYVTPANGNETYAWMTVETPLILRQDIDLDFFLQYQNNANGQAKQYVDRMPADAPEPEFDEQGYASAT